MDTHFLSAEEIITAASYQLQFPNKTGMASEGSFGSKFVTVCVSGDAENNIHLDGYQVSNQCMALVKDKILLPTRDAPELGYIKESSDEQYVPDVYFTAKDEYGNEIKNPGRSSTCWWTCPSGRRSRNSSPWSSSRTRTSFRWKTGKLRVIFRISTPLQST